MTLCIGKYRREKISDKYLLLFLKNCGMILSAIPLGSAFGSEKSNIQKWQLMKSKNPRNQTISRTFGTPWGIRTPGLLVRRLSQGQIGVISAPICAFYHRSLGGVSIVSVRPCPLFSDSGSKMGQAQFCNRDEQNSIIAKSRHDIYGLSEPYSTICCISLYANRSFAQPYCINKSLSKYLIACSLSQILHFTADHCHTRNSVLL